MLSRSPVVVVMGHVDHGKTTLLDYIRKTSVALREAGGITQSIGAYEIAHGDRTITFIDTPGHEAFSAMRQHGAKAADLAILVIAADDGVKPQTKDALQAITAEKTPYIVAINKIDTTGANIEKVKQDLAQIGVYLEGYGGNISWHAISAKTGEGIQDLLDLILLAADLEKPEYDPEAPASGTVLTARLDKRRGILVGAILENGILKRGAFIGTPSTKGKVKILENFMGKAVTSLSPSAPVLIMGFESLPEIGERFMASEGPIPEESLKPIQKNAPKPAAEEIDEKVIPLVLKADESGSLMAFRGVVEKLRSKHPFAVIVSSVGDIYETDVKSAESNGAIIVGFRTKVDRAAENLARAKKIFLLVSPIIYELEKELDKYAAKLEVKEVRALEVLAVFGQAKGKERVVGGRILLGPVKNQETFEIWQDKKILGTGRILNLQSERKDVLEAQTGTEVGLLAESEEPIKVGNRLVFSD